jgi:membrane-bound lytic murein transglycosylase D
VERTGYADFWELRARGVLPTETTNYVPIILAMTIMEKNAAEYGIEGFTLDPPLDYDTVETTAPTSLTLVADILDMSFTELAALNPASLRGMVPESYPIHVPKGSGNQLSAAMQMIPANRMDAWRMHRVGSGETLAAIGKRYGVTPANIVSANRMESAQAMEGDRLLIPAVQRIQIAAPATKSAAAKTTATASASRRKSTAKRTTTASARPVRKTPAKGALVARNAGN